MKLFTKGRNQAVLIPREYQLEGKEALMRKEGDKLIIRTDPPKSLLALLNALEPIEEDFASISDPPPVD